MDRLSLIIFGDFTEEERLLYFSDESINASGVEFPEHWNVLTSISSYSKQDCTQTESDVPLKVGEESNLYPEDVIQENLSPKEDASTSKESDEAFDGVSKINQVSEQIEVNSVAKCNSSITEDSDGCDCTPHTQTQCFYGEKRKIEVAECAASEYNGLSHENVNENCDNPTTRTDSESSKSDGSTPTNVVTVGTKTMMTTSTRTVESRNKVVKTSWADLFKTKPSSKPQGPLQQMKSVEAPPHGDQSVEDDSLSRKDQFQQYFFDVLKKVTLTTQVPSLQPRGLKNNGNWCYINSTLQVLLFCPSFYHFLMKFKLTTDRGTSFTPILDALVLFASQFSEMPPQHSTGRSRDRNKQEVVMGLPFEPAYVYKLLTQVKTTLSQQGKQEDAEEFLSCILNGLHDEMVQLTLQEKNPGPDASNHVAVGNQGVGEWEQVGPRNRSTVTRKATISESPIAAMFGGYLRSSVVQHGMKESASIQPFFTIPLDLRGEVSTVQQAFDNFFQVEEVEGFQCDKSKTEVEVLKKWTLDTLPVVLVLHLKRFVVNRNGCEKLTKKITYESQLQVPTETVSKVLKVRSKNMLTYKLFAVTYHHGKNLHGGHYTSDISHPAVGWLRADDVNVRLVPPKFVFNPLSNRDPYLLYYCRGDISGKDGV